MAGHMMAALDLPGWRRRGGLGWASSTRVNPTVYSGRFQVFVRQKRIRPEDSLAVYPFLERRHDCVYRYSSTREDWYSTQNLRVASDELLCSLDRFHAIHSLQHKGTDVDRNDADRNAAHLDAPVDISEELWMQSQDRLHILSYP